MDSLGGIGAGELQQDRTVGRLAFDRMWLTHTDRHTHARTSGLGLAQAVAESTRSSSKRSLTCEL